MKGFLRTILCLSLISIFAWDLVEDSAGHHDAGPDSVCHVCACGPHMTPQNSSSVRLNTVASTYVAYASPRYSPLFAAVIFHPPQLAV